MIIMNFIEHNKFVLVKCIRKFENNIENLIILRENYLINYECCLPFRSLVISQMHDVHNKNHKILIRRRHVLLFTLTFTLHTKCRQYKCIT